METTFPTNPLPLPLIVGAASAEGLDLVNLGAPVLADVDRIVDELDPVANTALMTIIAQPDVPRSLTVTVVDANNSVSAHIALYGVDMFGAAIQDEHDVVAGTAATKLFETDKIYARVTSVVLTGVSGAAGGDSIAVGVGNKIGLPKQILNSTAVKHVSVGAVPLTSFAPKTSPNSAVDASGGTYDGSKVMIVGYRPGT